MAEYKTIIKKDKKMVCNHCGHEFWAMYGIPKKFIQCLHCKSFDVETIRVDGHMVIENRQYQERIEDD